MTLIALSAKYVFWFRDTGDLVEDLRKFGDSIRRVDHVVRKCCCSRKPWLILLYSAIASPIYLDRVPRTKHSEYPRFLPVQLFAVLREIRPAGDHRE